jgi:hypothetical protein
MDTGIGHGMLEIAFGLMSIALIALLLNRSSDTAKVVSSVATNFDSLLRTVTLQGTTGIGRF